MISGIITLLVTLAPLFVLLITRAVKKKDDPNAQNETRKQEILREVVKNDERGANISLGNELERLRALQSDRIRQGSAAGSGK